MAGSFRVLCRSAALALLKLSTKFPVVGVAVVYEDAPGGMTAIYEGRGGLEVVHDVSVSGAFAGLAIAFQPEKSAGPAGPGL